MSCAKSSKSPSLIERIGHKIPDPVIIFATLYALLLLSTLLFGGKGFSTTAPNGGVATYQIKNMFTTEHIRWIFDNAILTNWLGYAGGILGTMLIVMFGIGVAEESGLLSVLIRKAGAGLTDKLLPFVLVFLGIMSNITTDAGYIVLIPLAGLLYAGIGKHPLIGMAAAFAGVSAGFSANLIPATVVDVIVGTNAQGFAQAQGVPFVSQAGKPLNPATMHYYFLVASTVLLVLLGGFVTIRFTRRRFEGQEYQLPDDIHPGQFTVSKEENRALWWALGGLLVSGALVAALCFGPLRPYADDAGNTISPYLDNIILLITLLFFVSGVCYGFAAKTFSGAGDLVRAMSKQIGSMGYVIVLTFFCYNFLALLTFSNVGVYITYIGARALQAIGAARSPVLLIVAFILITSLVNLFVGGLTSKWMLLGPIFIPMLYSVNASMTPDVVAAAYRLADSSTNIITPLMTYAGVVLLYMRKYQPKFSVGDLIGVMLPYSVTFLVSWTALLLLFVLFKIPLGF